MYHWRAFGSVWSELLKKDQSGHPNDSVSDNCQSQYSECARGLKEKRSFSVVGYLNYKMPSSNI